MLELYSMVYVEPHLPHRPDRPIPFALRLLRNAVRQIRIWRGRLQSLGKLSYGRNLMLGPDCWFLAPDFIRLGTNVSLGAGVIMESNVEIGDHTLVSSQVAFIGNDHDFRDPRATVFSGRRLPSSTAILEGDHLIGFRTIIVGNVRLGRGCIVGAGSIVTRDLPPYSICVGAPAKKVRDRFPDGAAARLSP
jgi:acetyltransferase-like isoleucine patch superfamily enzyme